MCVCLFFAMAQIFQQGPRSSCQNGYSRSLALTKSLIFTYFDLALTKGQTLLFGFDKKLNSIRLNLDNMLNILFSLGKRLSKMEKNNKGKAAGSGTASKARRERVQKAAQERDRLAAAGDPDAIAKKALADAKKEEAAKKKAAQAPPCPKEEPAASASPKEEPAASSSGQKGPKELGPSQEQLAKEGGQLKWQKVDKGQWKQVDKTNPGKVDKTPS